MKKVLLATIIAATSVSAMASQEVTFSADVPAVCSIALDDAATLSYVDAEGTAAKAEVTSNAINGITSLMLVSEESDVTLVDGTVLDVELSIDGEPLSNINDMVTVVNGENLDVIAFADAEAKEMIAGNQAYTATLEVSCTSAQ